MWFECVNDFHVLVGTFCVLLIIMAMQNHGVVLIMLAYCCILYIVAYCTLLVHKKISATLGIYIMSCP